MRRPALRRGRLDAVVIGGGLAGLSAVLGLAGLRVALVSKSRFGAGGSSPLAQGGIAAAVGPGDSPSRHAADTLAAAGGLAEFDVVHRLTREAPRQIERLLRLGARFDRDADGGLALGREAAHGRHRILHAGGDGSGAELMRAVAAAVAAQPRLEILERHFAEDLVRDGAGGIVGVVVRTPGGGRRLLAAPAVVLATGGAGRLFARTTNPVEATGDGLAMAARAGARLIDLEFVQFHPTALAVDADPMPLITEALRGTGALLVDDAGRRFMAEVHPAAELAPRDLLARAIWQRRQAGVGVYLDARPAAPVESRFPAVHRLCAAHGLDPDRQPVPVSPAAHYTMGGVWTDGEGRTSLTGLWACGEVASTGVHGANRLASNSLLEALVFGSRVARDVAAADRPAPAGADLEPPAPGGAQPVGAAAQWLRELRRLMWRHVGLVRDESGLQLALRRLEAISDRLPPGSSELHNLVLIGKLVAASAMRRRESRGSHFRRDFPSPGSAWRRRLSVSLRPSSPRWATAAGRPRRGAVQ